MRARICGLGFGLRGHIVSRLEFECLSGLSPYLESSRDSWKYLDVERFC